MKAAAKERTRKGPWRQALILAAEAMEEEAKRASTMTEEWRKKLATEPLVNLCDLAMKVRAGASVAAQLSMLAEQYRRQAEEK